MIWQVEKKNSLVTYETKPDIKSMYPIIYMFKTMRRKYVINLFIRKCYCIKSIIIYYVYSYCPRKLPLFFAVPNIVSYSFANLFCKWNDEPSRVTRGLKFRIVYTGIFNCFNHGFASKSSIALIVSLIRNSSAYHDLTTRQAVSGFAKTVGVADDKNTVGVFVALAR